MVRIITQELFNESVLENMTMFEIDVEEAIRETIDQFKTQNVDLSNVIKEKWCVLGEEDPLVTALERLTTNTEDKEQNLDILIDFCTKDLAFKLKAAKLGAYDKIYSIAKQTCDTKLLCKSIEAFTALMDGYPDLLDKDGLDLIFDILKNSNSVEVLTKTLLWTKICCIKHEKNRKLFMDMNVNDILKDLMNKNSNFKLLSEVCKLATSLTLDDDIRDNVSGSHVHSCILASSLLPSFVPLLDIAESEVVFQVLNTISSVLVRDTLCQQFVDLGGLQSLLKVISNDPSINMLTRCFNVLSCLAGHDEIKDSIIKAGLASRIAEALSNGHESISLCHSVLSLVARLSLRSQKNSKALYDAGLGELIVQVLKIYHLDKKVSSLSCLAIRNLVSHNPDLRAKFISLEVEDILRNMPKAFPDLADNSKSALLALDLDVNLKEEWTGKYGDKIRANE